MYHSITIGDKNTWDDWHLIPESRPLVNSPPVKSNYIEIPGGDGVLDLTAVMAGRPLYNNRTGNWSFIVQNGFRDWAVLYSEIMAYLHGQKMRAVLEDDPDFYYEGRFSVNQWRSDKDYSRIVIDYNVGPYKQYVAGSDKWLWDTFNFETDTIRYYKNLIVSGTLNIVVIGDMMDTIPVLVSSVDGMKVSYNGVSHTLSRGANQFGDIVLHFGENNFTFTGNGRITINIVGGRL